MAFRKKFVISDECLNSYGFWLKNSGAKMDNFKKNAPAFYNHRTYDLPLGHWENIKLENNQWTAELVIEGASDIEREYIRKIENGDIKGASVGFDPLTLSEDAKDLKPGQRRPTVTAWEPFEASITPLPANVNATIALRSQARGLQLTSEGESEDVDTILPKLKLQKKANMEKIAILLGLAAAASEEQVSAAIADLKKKADNAEALSKHVEDLAKKQLTEEQHAFFIELNKTSPASALNFLKLNSKEQGTETPDPAAIKVSDLLKEAQAQLGKDKEENKEKEDKESYLYLSKHNPQKLMDMKRSDPERFKKLEREYLDSKKTA